MAKVRGPGLSLGARGSVGGVQFRKTRRENIVCLYKNKPGVVSGPQSVIRACMSSLVVHYHTLSAEQLAAWRSYGAAFNFRWGAFAYFTYINMPRCRAGDPLLSWPPGYPVTLSAWELDLSGDICPAITADVGAVGLWDLAAVPDVTMAPLVGAASDTFWTVNVDGDLMPVIA